MTEFGLMLIASQLISNPTSSAVAQYAALNQQDKAMVEEYIASQNQLPNEIENLIYVSYELQRTGFSDQMDSSPTRESYEK